MRMAHLEDEETRVLEVINLLVSRGATADGEIRGVGVSPLGTTVAGTAQGHGSVSTTLRLGLMSVLLRAGASLENCLRGEPIEAAIQYNEANNPWLANDPSFAAGKTFLAEVRAAGGTWRKYLRAPHKRLVPLRALVLKERAKKTDPVLAFVFGLGDNGLFWKLLEFWPGRAYLRTPVGLVPAALVLRQFGEE